MFRNACVLMGTAVAGALLLLFQPRPAVGQEQLAIPVRFDRWMYPFNGTPGARVTGSTFGAIGQTIFDDLDAQVLLGFDTQSQLQPLVAQDPRFQLLAATVELTTATDNAFQLDPTIDRLGSYADPTTDEDPGRPVMLFGVGTRSGYSQLGLTTPSSTAGPPTFEETDPFGRPGPPAPQIRHAFASDDGIRDISNLVRDSLEVTPWAIGRSQSLAAGADVPVLSPIAFDVDLSRPLVRQQIEQGLQKGSLFFSVASLHSATAGSNQGIPTFFLGDLSQASTGPRATLHLTYRLVPEPGSATLFALALLGIGRRRLARRPTCEPGSIR